MALMTDLAALICVTLGAWGWWLVRVGDEVPRLEVAAVPMTRQRSTVVARLFDRSSRLLGPRVLPLLSERRLSKIGQRLGAAGRPQELTVERFVGRWATFAGLFTITGMVLIADGLLLVGLLSIAFGLTWTDLWLGAAVRHRQGIIERALPDFLDIAAVTIASGMGYRAALSMVGQAQSGPLAEEMRTTLHQLDLGVSRRTAFQELRARNDSPTLAQFVTSLLQAEELGAPLSIALVGLAQDLRRSAAQDARRKAARATPRVSLVVSLVLVPGAMILMIAGLFLGSNVHLSRVLHGG